MTQTGNRRSFLAGPAGLPLWAACASARDDTSHRPGRAITIDDFDLSDSTMMDGEIRDSHIRNSLRRHRTKAAGFVAGKYVVGDPSNRVLQSWSDDGQTTPMRAPAMNLATLPPFSSWSMASKADASRTIFHRFRATVGEKRVDASIGFASTEYFGDPLRRGHGLCCGPQHNAVVGFLNKDRAAVAEPQTFVDVSGQAHASGRRNVDLNGHWGPLRDYGTVQYSMI